LSARSKIEAVRSEKRERGYLSIDATLVVVALQLQATVVILQVVVDVLDTRHRWNDASLGQCQQGGHVVVVAGGAGDVIVVEGSVGCLYFKLQLLRRDLLRSSLTHLSGDESEDLNELLNGSNSFWSEWWLDCDGIDSESLGKCSQF